MSLFVKTFQPRFAAMVESGYKTQTIRPIPKRMPKVGDTISCRAWTGKPYRSKQRILRPDVLITDVMPITIDCAGVWFKGIHTKDHAILDLFAAADGFGLFPDMLDWFEKEHGIPFRGILIRWEKKCYPPTN